MDDQTADKLRESVARQDRILRSSLILNPVENVPFAADIEVASSTLHGLYNTDKSRSREQRLQTDMQFSGRRALERDSRTIYDEWAKALRAADATLRVLSGLHAHIVMFMAISEPGQSVLLLPERAGGHTSAHSILTRLGLEVIEMAVDDKNQQVDIASTLDRCKGRRPDFVFVDRSEGLVVEDFATLTDLPLQASIFDGSQYLTNILSGDHPNPFDSGFDLIVASVHKNFPGPQKALLATRSQTDLWSRLLRGISTFVSNMHSTSTYAAGLTLGRSEWLCVYSKRMLSCAVSLENELSDRGVPVVIRPPDRLPTHHLWLQEPTKEDAYNTYEALERCRILTNFRKLPYGLGFGLRMGVNAAVRIGLEEDDIPQLADLITGVRADGPSPSMKALSKEFNESIWERM